MYEAINIAATGLWQQQTRIDTIADNVANVNTVGFKGARYDFKDALYSAGIGRTATPEGNLQKGHGVMRASITDLFTGGSLNSTGVATDFSIEGDGFFEVMDASGNLRYTRAGNFYTTPVEDGGFYLVTANGYFVLDAAGEKIEIPEDAYAMEVSQTGAIRFVTAETATEEAAAADPNAVADPTAAAEEELYFGIYTFENKHGLAAAGLSNYAATDASGAKLAVEEPQVTQGVLEMSNVNLAEEMTRLIRAQRAFSLASRALRTADEMEGVANNMRR